MAYWRAIAQLKPHRLLEPGRMSAHQHLQERLASNCRITRHGDSLVPSGAWLQELLPAVHDGGGLTVGGLRVALGSSDAAVTEGGGEGAGSIGQQEWIATASTLLTGGSPLWTLCLLAGSSGGWEGVCCQGRWAPSAPG